MLMGGNPTEVNKVVLKQDHVSLLNQFNQLCTAIYFYGASKFSFFEIRHRVQFRLAKLIYIYLLDGIVEKDFSTTEETLWLFISSLDSDLASPEKSTTKVQLTSGVLSSHQTEFCQSSLISWLLICCHRGVLAKKLKSGFRKHRSLLAKYYSKSSLVRCPLHRRVLIGYIQTIEEYRPEQLVYLRLIMVSAECLDFTDDISYGEEATEDLVLSDTEYAQTESSTKSFVLPKMSPFEEDLSNKSLYSKESGSDNFILGGKIDCEEIDRSPIRSPNTADAVSENSRVNPLSHPNSSDDKSHSEIPQNPRTHRRIKSDLTDLKSHFQSQKSSPPVYSTVKFGGTANNNEHSPRVFSSPQSKCMPLQTALSLEPISSIHNPHTTLNLSIMDFSANMERDVAHFELAERLISGMESLYCDRTLSKLRLHHLPSIDLSSSLDQEVGSIMERMEGRGSHHGISRPASLHTSFSLQNLSQLGQSHCGSGALSSRNSWLELNRYWMEVGGGSTLGSVLSADTTSKCSLHSGAGSDVESSASTVDLREPNCSAVTNHQTCGSESKAHYISAKLLEIVKLSPEEIQTPEIQNILMRPGVLMPSLPMLNIDTGRKDSTSTECFSPPPMSDSSLILSRTNPSGPPSLTKSSSSSQAGISSHILRENSIKKSADDWESPKFEIIINCVPKNKRNDVLKQQKNRCAGCGMNVDSACLKRLRFCEYYGKFFCSVCHTNTLMLVPGHVIQNFDLSMLPVSNFARNVLDRIFNQYLFNLKELNPNLMQNREIHQVERLRTQLKHLLPFMETCRDCGPILSDLKTQRRHWFENYFYTMHDFELLRQRQLIEKLRRVVLQCTDHIKSCALCQAKGFFCELCQDKAVIFTFQTRITSQCPHCGALFHTQCLNKYRLQRDTCPRCQRIQERRRRVGTIESAVIEFDDVVEEDLLIESKEEDAGSVNTIT